MANKNFRIRHGLETPLIAGEDGSTAITLDGSGYISIAGLNVDSGTLYVDATNNRVGINNLSPTTSLDIAGGLYQETSTSAERPVFQYNNSAAGTNSGLFLRKNFGTTAYATGSGAGLAIQIDSDSQVTNQIAIVDATYDSTASPNKNSAIRLRTNTLDNTVGPFTTVASFSTDTATLEGNLTVSGSGTSSIAGNLNIDGTTLSRGTVVQYTNDYTATLSTANQVIDSWSTATYRNAKYTIQVAFIYDAVGPKYYYKSIDISVIAKHDNSAAFIIESNELDTVGFDLSTFSVAMSGSTLQLRASPYSTSFIGAKYRIDATLMTTI